MRITTARRISQIFFLVLFVWLCVVSTSGQEWFQKRGWPVNWLLQLDPLVAVGTAIAAGMITVGLLWAMATFVLTILFGRAFCGWLCPFGTLHQAVGWLGRRGRPVKDRLAANRYRRWQSAKYCVLAVMLGAGATSMLAGWRGEAGTLVTGLLDPMPLIHRSVNLIILPISDRSAHDIWPSQRLHDGTLLMGAIFAGAILANLAIPRFYCRFICPLGALLGFFSRISLFRIGRRPDRCTECGLCEKNCEGACSPATRIRSSECVMCLNCITDCRHDAIGYSPHKSPGEITAPDASRRGVVLSLASGLAAAPLLRLGGKVSANWPAGLVRPPGSLAEGEFLKRCIKCGQCMRICPTNVLQPAGMQFGFEALWTPVLNNRIGTSGCQLNCVACSHICLTGAIRPISLDEKLGQGKFADRGPLRLGTAFFDRGRCLPWAMDRPCLVCQENCPVSPKAIFGREVFQTVRDGVLTVRESATDRIALVGAMLTEGQWATGDYYVSVPGAAPDQRRQIVQQTSDMIRIDAARPWDDPPPPASDIEVQVRLQRPYVDPARCIGCGTCEHECPVSGKRAIRVTAENETRSKTRSLLL
ncbi:MAG: 4Fe-4S binding protein [Planctomycetota bacterium]|jgi:polyferredoxin